MMQAFRNAAKPLMVVVAITFFAWLVLDLSGITGGTGLLTQTSVGKVNGRSIDARTYQSIVQQSIDARQRQSPSAMGLEDYQQVRDEVWDQIIQSSVLDAEYRRRGYRSATTRSSRLSGAPHQRNSGTFPTFRPTASSISASISAGSHRASPNSISRGSKRSTERSFSATSSSGWSRPT